MPSGSNNCKGACWSIQQNALAKDRQGAQFTETPQCGLASDYFGDGRIYDQHAGRLKSPHSTGEFKILLYCLECLCNPRRGGRSGGFSSFAALQVAA